MYGFVASMVGNQKVMNAGTQLTFSFLFSLGRHLNDGVIHIHSGKHFQSCVSNGDSDPNQVGNAD